MKFSPKLIQRVDIEYFKMLDDRLDLLIEESLRGGRMIEAFQLPVHLFYLYNIPHAPNQILNVSNHLNIHQSLAAQALSQKIINFRVNQVHAIMFGL